MIEFIDKVLNRVTMFRLEKNRLENERNKLV